MRIVLIHNSGAGDALHDRDSLLQLIRSHGHEVEYVSSTDGWTSRVQRPAELVVAAGGDGTVGKLARRLAGTGIPMGVLPLGTANNIATALGIADTPIRELVARWARATPIHFDTGHINGQGDPSRFVESVGLGLLAESIAEITEGGSGYVNELDDAEERTEAAIDVMRQILRRLEPTRVEMVIDGEDHSGEYLLVEVMNFGSAGPNLRLAPDAAHADGLFDIVIADASHRGQLLEDLPRYQRGERPAHPLPVRRGRHLTLSAADYRLHLDDRLRACQGRLEVIVEPHALIFLV